MPNTLLQAETRQSLASRVEGARARTDEIFAIVKPQALYDRPIPERHRLVFYLGHVEAFDWNLIARQAFGIEPFNEAFDRLFAFGIDPVGGGLPNEPASDWPEPGAIRDYNERVRRVVDECLDRPRSPRSEGDHETIFNMAIEHRLMHAETLAYLLHQLPYDCKVPRADASPPLPPGEVDPSRTADIPAGPSTLGRARAGGAFGWDNEFDELRVQVPGFSIDAHKVTNGRYREFLCDGGYRRRDLWSEAGWAWKEREGASHPHFWRERGGTWFYRGMFAEIPLPLNAPVYVSHDEASAFARWAGRALPTEPQFHRAAYGSPDGGEREYPWGAEPPERNHGNFDLRFWDPTPLGAFPDGDSAFGVSELVGNGWEWTASVFGPFPGFRPHPFYEGYSANFFDGEHYVQKGGSPRTGSCMLRRSFRNWFQSHYPYVYAGFRLAGS